MYRETYKSALGHVCTGGGAEITNSPINLTVNLTVNIGDGAAGIGSESPAIIDILNKLLSLPSRSRKDDTQAIESHLVQGNPRANLGDET